VEEIEQPQPHEDEYTEAGKEGEKDVPVKKSPTQTTKEIQIGSAAVTFDTISSSRHCATALNSVVFQGRKLFTKVLIPVDLFEKEQEEQRKTEQEQQQQEMLDSLFNDIGASDIPVELNPSPQCMENADEIIYDEAIQKEVEDVENFLDSLL
jgi:RNA recognition motif-containing protein